MTPADRINLTSAALSGDADLMRRVSEAQVAILSVLNDSDMPLTDFHRAGLLVALEELAGSLSARAEFLEESRLAGGGES